MDADISLNKEVPGEQQRVCLCLGRGHLTAELDTWQRCDCVSEFVSTGHLLAISAHTQVPVLRETRIPLPACQLIYNLRV